MARNEYGPVGKCPGYGSYAGRDRVWGADSVAPCIMANIGIKSPPR